MNDDTRRTQSTTTPVPAPAIWLAAVLTLVGAFAVLATSCGDKEQAPSSRATQVTSRHQLVGGLNALGDIGDYRLENDKVQLVVQDETFNRGSGLFGGSLIDADLQRTNQDGEVINGGNGADTFGELFPSFFLEAINPGTVEVVDDGSGGESAIVEVRGHGGEFVTMLRYINQIMVNSYEAKKPGDILQEAGRDELEPPQSDRPLAEFRTRYILDPGARHVQIESRVKNESFQTLQFPNQEILDDISGVLGLDLEGFTVPAGHVVGFGAVNDLFVPGIGYDLRWGLEEAYRKDVELPAFPGKLTQFLATSNPDGISYGFITEKSPADNFPYRKDQGDEALYNGEAEPDDMLLLFYASGFSGSFTHQLPEKLSPSFCKTDAEYPDEEAACQATFGDCDGDETCEKHKERCERHWESCTDARDEHPSSYSYTNYFIVGDGTVSSILDEVYEIRGIETQKVEGRIYDDQSGSPVGEDVEMLIYEPRPGTSSPDEMCSKAGEAPDEETPVVLSQTFTNSKGYFDMTLPSGDYCYRVRESGRPLGPYRHFEVGDSDRSLRAVAGSSARVHARVTAKKNSQPMPAKLTVVGTHDYYENDLAKRHFLYDLEAGEPWRSSDGVPDRKDAANTRRYIESTAYGSADGVITEQIPPGEYTLYFSRGPEYELVRRSVDLDPGETARLNISLEDVVDTSDYISGDFHMHAQGSIDSGLDYTERIISIAAEDVEVVVSSDHNYVSDYLPYIRREGLQEWLRSIVGIELTTFEFGHFNAFPLETEVGSINRGSIKWQNVPPQHIFDELRSRGSLPDDQTIIQVNHPRDSILGYFSQFNVDPFTATGGLAFEQGSNARERVISTLTMSNGDGFIRDCRSEAIDCVTNCPDGGCDEPRFETQLSWDFDALEIFNGKHLEQMRHHRVPYSEDEWPISTVRELAEKKCGCDDPAQLVRDRCCENGYASPTDQACDDDPTEGMCPVDQMSRAEISEDYPENAVVCDEDKVGYPGGLDDWYNMLNTTRGWKENRPGATREDSEIYHKVTATGNSDSHSAGKPYLRTPGHPRNYFHVGHDDYTRMSERDLSKALRNHRNIITNGPFALLDVTKGERTAEVGQQMTIDDESVTLEVLVRAADWVGADAFRIVANGEPLDLSKSNDVEPVTKQRKQTLDDQQITGSGKWFQLELGDDGEWTGEFEVELDRDTWFVLEVAGENNLFPVYQPMEIPRIPFDEIIGQIAGSFGFGGGVEDLEPNEVFPTRPFAFTNPVWVVYSGDGGAGQFDPPGIDPETSCQGKAFQPQSFVEGEDIEPHRDIDERLDSVSAPLDLKDRHDAPLSVPRGEMRDVRTLFRAWGH